MTSDFAWLKPALDNILTQCEMQLNRQVDNWVQNGNATLPVLAPHLSEKQLRNHALIIHAGDDNYADTPTPLGGGGQRIACGVVCPWNDCQ